jgi:hypothetical protein
MSVDDSCPECGAWPEDRHDPDCARGSDEDLEAPDDPDDEEDEPDDDEFL